MAGQFNFSYTTNQFSGRALDKYGKPIPDAQVTLNSKGVHKSTKTTKDGYWNIKIDDTIDPKQTSIVVSKEKYSQTTINNPQLTNSNQTDNRKYVVFIAGLDLAGYRHADQVKAFKDAFGDKYIVKDFRYTQTKAAQDFLNSNKNNILAVIMFSAGCTNANKFKNYYVSQMYCIEPWNGDSTDAGRAAIYKLLPSGNMYISGKLYARGKGTKSGANITDNKKEKVSHAQALINSARDIAPKIKDIFN